MKIDPNNFPVHQEKVKYSAKLLRLWKDAFHRSAMSRQYLGQTRNVNPSFAHNL